MNKARKRRRYKKNLRTRAYAKLRKGEMPSSQEACEAINVGDKDRADAWAKHNLGMIDGKTYLGLIQKSTSSARTESAGSSGE